MCLNVAHMAQKAGRMHRERSGMFVMHKRMFAEPPAKARRRLRMCGESGRMHVGRGRMPPGRCRVPHVRGRIAAAGLAIGRGSLALAGRFDAEVAFQVSLRRVR